MSTTETHKSETHKSTNGDKKAAASGAAEGIAEGIIGSVEGLSTIARDQAAQSLEQGERAAALLRDESIMSIRAAEVIGLSLLSALDEVTAPLSPRLPSLVPVGSLDAAIKAGFDVTQQLLETERKLAESAVALVVRRTAAAR